MSIYELPKTEEKELNKKNFKNIWNIIFFVFILLISIFMGLNIGSVLIADSEENKNTSENVCLTEESMVISTTEESMPSVVSVIIEKTAGAIYEEYNSNDFLQIIPYYGEEDSLEQVGAGTGFIVSEDGLIITNKHVVEDENAVYSILTDDGKKYEVDILSKNPVQDIAILKIKNASGEVFKPLTLGDSSTIKLGQTAIAIGNVLGEFQNTVSVGVISGLERDVVAQGNGKVEKLEDIIQTDAAINQGNSGGPLLNLKGEVIGINTAVSLSGESIGFAIPINVAKRDLNQIISEGKIAYPFLGIRYVIINDDYKDEYEVTENYGAFIIFSEDNEESSVIPDSPADKANLKEGDLILEVNSKKVDEKNTLTKIMLNYFPNDEVVLKVLRDGEEILVPVTLGNWDDYNE
ncbi:MAG: trypsin-like peptidase domain-containing protein [Candidatus Pacebacteria bacterium]|nr:trypsin-like peptidase domain-containing protein [Candidatus Paceibacterota bacterium]